jgi:omega-amidase
LELKVALAQMAISAGRPDQNEATARTMAAQAAERGSDLLVLPELWPTGYDLGCARETAAQLHDGPFAVMAELARAYQLYVLGTAMEANPDGLPFNTAALYGPEGDLLGVYRKVHLFPPMGEVEHMTPGSALPTFDLPWGRLALAVCYDLRFPELWRRYAYDGAHLVLIPAEWPIRRVEHWRLLLRARAVENQLFVVGCNRGGGGDDGTFGGHSAVIDPWGRALVEGGVEPGMFLATLGLEEVSRARERFPFLKDRRPEVYG